MVISITFLPLSLPHFIVCERETHKVYKYKTWKDSETKYESQGKKN